MNWGSDLPIFEDFYGSFTNSRPVDYRPFKMNERCFVRPDHECGKVFGASKSCFIACPSDDSLEPMLALISEKLQKSHIEPIIAVKERAYGKDIFCTKICGKIIESKFCLAILDDAIKDNVNVPNPNVYYEYGMMTALKKYIIPLQKEELTLAFNIRSHDTIKYTPKNLAIELDRAIRDAIFFTEKDEKKEVNTSTSVISKKGILRDLEIAGFKSKDKDWFLNYAISDTNFRGFGHDEKEFYIYLGIIDTSKDCEIYLDDINIILYRTEKIYNQLLESEHEIKENIVKIDKIISTVENPRRPTSSFQIMNTHDDLRRYETKLQDNLSKRNNLKILYIGFINRNNIDLNEFEKNCFEIITKFPRVKLVISKDDKIQFGDVVVNLKAFKSST
ncbi:MAG: hypothetical protein WC484_08260 [Candidatus Omnitrophota bacterium]|jgi:hypothetical protein